MQFLLVGGLISLIAMVLVGTVVTSLIEAAVTRNSAAATALYVDSVIAPLLPDMQQNEVLSDTVTRALDETLGQGALGRRLASFKLWRGDGTILYSSDGSSTGKQLPLDKDVENAFSGDITADYERSGLAESGAERGKNLPLLKIYNPILQPWSGEVVAVAEFHEVATDFERSLWNARVRSWLAVAGVTLGFFLILSAIVFRGSRTIDRQRHALRGRVGQLSDLLDQNRALHARVQRASERATALNESYLRRIGADLHDGPAQLIALAALRLDSKSVLDPGVGSSAREAEIMGIKGSLDEALHEIRSICNGLVLPHIEAAEIPDILRRAVRAHEQRTATKVDLTLSEAQYRLPASAKICIYRFVQEALNNAFRHGGGRNQRVVQAWVDGCVEVEVADGGPGFDPASIKPDSLGLAGLRERIESLGGQFTLESTPKGTRVKLCLNKNQMEHA
ncbi:sensor histidine kinase [Pseudaminobacter sp. 19-2017]|uniref:histidine kinase n=1 Tax=Pseudaminobacter soli (ex Zhang et al. 2022) TaxID=2831468 RepID=A0A942DVN9_9HYPH|nr:sensor histidine kinase [Pseudaminobacter soli]MBS3647593.1 sensor histidine kinase [Pseudaminobacter soli]